jgi:hypothetical protein
MSACHRCHCLHWDEQNRVSHQLDHQNQETHMRQRTLLPSRCDDWQLYDGDTPHTDQSDILHGHLHQDNETSQCHQCLCHICLDLTSEVVMM